MQRPPSPRRSSRAVNERFNERCLSAALFRYRLPSHLTKVAPYHTFSPILGFNFYSPSAPTDRHRPRVTLFRRVHIFFRISLRWVPRPVHRVPLCGACPPGTVQYSNVQPVRRGACCLWPQARKPLPVTCFAQGHFGRGKGIAKHYTDHTHRSIDPKKAGVRRSTHRGAGPGDRHSCQN